MDDRQIGGIDLLLLDIKMPVMDGFALQEHLATAGFSIPIVFMTSYEVDKMRAKLMGKGSTAFLQKPIDEKDLLAAIREGLNEGFRQKNIDP